jgi:cytochrome c biogenesis protein CcmG/thiol:disulfide interchange protein DsbE
MGAMSLSRVLAGVLLFVTLSLSAATSTIPVLNAGTVTYRNVEIIGANATDLYFTYDQGIGNVKLKYLSKDLQKRFNYDAKAAAEAEKKQAESDALYQSAVISNMAVRAKALAAKSEGTNGVRTLVDAISDKSLLGKPAPKVDLENWAGEKPDMEGKYVILSFWAPWSAASRQCIPELNALQKQFADRLVVIGVTPAALEKGDLSVEPKPAFACAADPKAKLSSAASITSIPTVLLLDANRIVLYEGHPAGITEKKLQALLTRTTQ